jgi:copper chaperone CopZ
MNPLRVLPILLVLVAGGVLGWIASRAPDQDYEPVVIEEADLGTYVPRALIGEIPDGHVVRTLDVSGMCCGGCSGKLYAALQETPGVMKAAVSFEDGTASALVPDDLETGQLEVALTFDKYSATLRD